jgi:hypothetical protein
MRYALPLEIIGRHGVRATRPKPYVERLHAFSPAHGWSLTRLEPQPDVSDANGVGSRGIRLNFWLEPGIYRAFQHLSQNRDRIIYLQVRGDATAADIGRERAMLLCRENAA